jgi:hypothetical protein
MEAGEEFARPPHILQTGIQSSWESLLKTGLEDREEGFINIMY